jgi:D-glycero-alpha-D-manno-heptose-7-phosphate kinase
MIGNPGCTNVLITRTPFRLSLYGGGLDYPEWYAEHPVKILCAGLDYYCYHTIRRLPPFFSYKYRACYSIVETASRLDDIDHPAVREVFRKYGRDIPLELSHIGDLPSKSGIGSSSAFTVGLINSLSALNGKHLGRADLAKKAIEIEHNVLKESVGIQDQCAASFGGLVYIDANSSGVSPREFITTKDYRNYFESHTLMGFDGLPRFSGKYAKQTVSSILSSQKRRQLEALSDLSIAGITAFARESDISEHASITREAREIKNELNNEIYNKRSNEIIQETERAGSLCTRFMGAGGGGFFVCYAPPHKHNAIKESVKVSTWVDVKLSRGGSQVVLAE